MKTIDLYVQDVLSHVAVSDEDRARIEADLRAHFEESMAAGLTEEEALARMGPPEEVAAEFMSTLTPAYATHPRRLGAVLLDCTVVFGISGLIFLSLFWFLLHHGDVFASGMESAPLAPILMFPLLGAIVSLLPLAYFVFSEWLTGRTLGKWLFGLTVTDEGGRRPTFSSVLVRHLSILFFPAFVIDGAILLVTEKRQRGLELLAHTTVLNSNSSLPAAAAWFGLLAFAGTVLFVGYMLARTILGAMQ